MIILTLAILDALNLNVVNVSPKTKSSKQRLQSRRLLFNHISGNLLELSRLLKK